MPKRSVLVPCLAVLASCAAFQASAQQSPLYWSYAAKFVCGVQYHVPAGEPPVKPGNYATEINIHNPYYRESQVRKKIIVLVDNGQRIGREPQQQGPRAYDGIVLGPDYATMDDCDRLWMLTHPGVPLPMPMPITIGYLVLISKDQLDVDAVYTNSTVVPAATPAGLALKPGGISIDVERVEGKQVEIPAGLFPGGHDIERPVQP
jgi:hypothetical protein